MKESNLYMITIIYTCLQLLYATLDLGRGTLVTGVLKMVSSHSGILLSAISGTSKESSWEFTVTAAMVVVG